MPSSPLHPCTYPGCRELTNQRRCTAHANADRQAIDRRRGSPAERGYGSQWRKVRAVHLSYEPLCRMCKADGVLKEANEVDHIDGNSFNNDDTNLRSLCKPCHSSRTARDQGLGAGRRSGAHV